MPITLAGQALVGGHLSTTPLVATYENHSRKRPAPVTDTFFTSRGCPLTRASTVPKIIFYIREKIIKLCNENSYHKANIYASSHQYLSL